MPASLARTFFARGRQPMHCTTPIKSSAPKLDDTIRCDDRDCSHSLLIRELQHRIRNLLTLVQYLVSQTHSATVRDYREALLARIGNLADASDLIESTQERRISLDALLSRTLKPYMAVCDDRIYSSGPDVDLEPRLGLALHMIFHELATNACKYGALASLSGRGEMHWSMRQDADGRKLALLWRERNGPQVCGPQRSGFGLNLVTKALTNAEVELRFERTGVVCQMLVEIDKFSR